MSQTIINPCQYLQDSVYKICMEDPNSKMCKFMNKKYSQCVDRQLQLGTISKMCHQSRTALPATK